MLLKHKCDNVAVVTQQRSPWSTRFEHSAGLLRIYQPLVPKTCKELQVKMLRDSKKAGWVVA